MIKIQIQEQTIELTALQAEELHKELQKELMEYYEEQNSTSIPTVLYRH